MGRISTFCEGKPKAGKIKSTPEIICTTQGTAFFELTGASDETGTSIKWEYADSANHANGNWTTINTTNTSWQANITNNYYFRAIVFCEKSEMSDTTEEYFLFVDVNQEVLGPLITVAPTNTTVCAGDTVMLTATVSDNRKISYSWEPAESLSSGSGDTVYKHQPIPLRIESLVLIQLGVLKHDKQGLTLITVQT